MRFLVAFLMFTSIASADVVVVYDPATADIYSISDKADAVVPAGFKISTLPGKAEQYQRDTKDYKLVDGQLALNLDKIKARNERKRFDVEKQAEYDAVSKRAQKIAYEQLKTEGVKFKYITDDTFK